MAGPILLSSFPIKDRLDSSGLEALPSQGSGSLPNNQLFESMEPKDPEHLPKDPTSFFPLTKENMTTNLPRILRQFYSYDYSHINSYKAISAQLYTPQARFDYPVATFRGRDAVTAFWTLFLLQRATQLINVYGLHIDMTWDPVKLQALVQLESWHHMTPLAWVDKLLGVPAWKVWTTQVMQFVASPEDGPGALRLDYQEELLDQHVFLGLIPLSVYSVRTDPGTLLHAVRDQVRAVAGWAVQTGVHVVETVMEAIGWQ